MPSHRLFPRVDWDKVEAGSYAVVDPVNTGNILYLSEQDYVIMIRVALTSSRSLKVLAQPGDKPDTKAPTGPSSDNQNSPHKGHPWLSVFSRKGGSRAMKRVRYQFHSPFSSSIWRTGALESSMIKIHRGNLMNWLKIWSFKLHFLARGSRSYTTVHHTETMAFGHFLLKTLKNQGLTALIGRLKVMLFVVNTYLGGKSMTNTKDLGLRIRLTNGLPCAIPLYQRQAIRSRNLSFIRIWVSILNSYKAFEGVYELPPLATIVQPHPNLAESPFYSDFQEFIAEFWKRLRKLGGNLKPNFTVKDHFYTTKAGPNHPNSVLGSGIDAYAWTLQPRNLIRGWMALTGQHDLHRNFRIVSKMVPLLQATGFTASKPIYRADGTIKKWVPVALDKLVLGRLHALYEAAGKVRVVAIVDYWTQLVLKPVHDWMFSLLELIPSDATFDQEGKVKEFANRGYKEIYSLDLKAATDTIPFGLYTMLFKPIMGTDMVGLWKDILIDRDFLKPSELRTDPDCYVPPTRLHAIVHLGLNAGFKSDLWVDEFVRYTCGQPMGALSSWSSMALCHHLLVQYSAWICGYREGWFLDYLVLGDDVVIANANVAYAYQHLLASFGIKVGLAKSFISETGMFNFANQSYVLNENISPLSLKEEVGITTLPARVEFALRAVRRGWISMLGSNWLSGLLRQFVTPSAYRDIVADLRNGKLHPYVTWITSVLFCPGVTRLEPLGVKGVSINTFLACLGRRMSLWTKPIASLSKEGYGMESEALILAIIRESADRLYKEFLDSRELLKVFQEWLIGQTSVSTEYILKKIFEEQRQDAVSRWSEDYRTFVKTLSVTMRMLPLSGRLGDRIFLVEHTLSMPIDEIVRVLTQAEQSLPKIPDFAKGDISVLTQKTISSNDALDKFLKTAKILGAVSLDAFSAQRLVKGISSNKQKRTDS